jgi:hypothetical protein
MDVYLGDNVMLKRIALISLLVILAFVTVQAQDTQPVTPAAREIYTVLSYGDDVFEPDTWLASASEEPTRTTGQWRNDSVGGLAYLDYIHFDTPILEAQLGDSFGPAWFDAVLYNYDEWRELTTCTVDGIIIHDFSLLENNLKYTMRYWVQWVSESRVLAMFVIFPTDDSANLSTYSERLFPNAAVCAG